MKLIIVGISGVTCGGKTTLATGLHQFLSDPINANTFDGIRINQVELIHQDKYFYARDSSHHTWIPEINFINREIISAIDMCQMWTDVQNTVNSLSKRNNSHVMNDSEHCNEGNILEENHLNNEIIDAGNEPTTVNILIIEGFLIFNDERINAMCHIRFHVHLPFEICYARRIKRTFKHVCAYPRRYFEEYTWPNYQKYLSEVKNSNGIEFISGLDEPNAIFDHALKLISNVI